MRFMLLGLSTTYALTEIPSTGSAKLSFCYSPSITFNHLLISSFLNSTDIFIKYILGHLDAVH